MKVKEKLSENKRKFNEETLALIWAISAGVIMLTLVGILGYFSFFRVVPKFEVKNLELGKEVPSKVYNYVTGLPVFHEGIEIDYSQVDNMTEGDYEVIVSGEMNFTCTIHVQDTKAPVIEVLGSAADGCNVINADSGVYYSEADGCIILELGETYSVLDLLSSVSDTSDRYQVGLTCNGAQKSLYSHLAETVTCELFKTFECGDFVYEVLALDLAGNSSSAIINAKVVDTKGPQISLFDYDKYYATDREYTVEDFFENIEDPSGVADYCFVINGNEADIISYTEIGSYDIAIKAVDNIGNESVTNIKGQFDSAPVFVGVREEICVPTGKTFDFAQYFRAFDNTDGDISARLCVSCDGLDMSVAGSYDYECWVADSHGLISTYSGTVVVGTEDGRSYSLTEEEIDILNTYDYFNYEPLEEDSYELMIEMVEPTLVNLLRRYSNGGYCYGSAYIYKIDSDYIYIGTVEHVISEMISTNVEMKFCDDEETLLEIYVSGFERVDANSETAMIKIPTSAVPSTVLLDLKQVYVDENIYSEMSIGQEIVAYSGHWSNTTPTIRELYIRRLDEQFMDGAAHCIVTSHNTKGGMSGCPIFDLQGRMVALCEGYWGRFNYDIYAYEYEGYQQRIEGLNDLYERVKELPYNDAG